MGKTLYYGYNHVSSSLTYTYSRELAEWFKAVNLKFIKLYKLHPFKSDIL